MKRVESILDVARAPDPELDPKYVPVQWTPTACEYRTALPAPPQRISTSSSASSSTRVLREIWGAIQ